MKPKKVARTYPTLFPMGKQAICGSHESLCTLLGSLTRCFKAHPQLSPHCQLFCGLGAFEYSRRHNSRTEGRSSSWIEALNSSSKELSNELSTEKIDVGLHPEISTPT